MRLHCGGCWICLLFIYVFVAAYFVFFHNLIFDSTDNGVVTYLTCIYHLICNPVFSDVRITLKIRVCSSVE